MTNAKFTIPMIASVCHEANRRYAFDHLNDKSHDPWSDATLHVQQSAIDGVRFAIGQLDEAGRLEALSKVTPESMHANWRRFKEAEGWTYGEQKDVEKKTHPNLRPFSDLPAAERAKDALFLGIVKAFYLSGEIER